MDTGQILGWGALVVSVAGALNSLRRTRLDEKSGAVSDLAKVVQTYKEEIERLKVEQRESEDECRRQVQVVKDQNAALLAQLQEMRGTIITQANQISQLERRRQPREGA